MPDKPKTGVFYVKDPTGVVVMRNGLEVARYNSVQALVDAHIHGMDAVARLEDLQDQELQRQYTAYPPDPAKPG